jgi:hypothetical protein
MRKSTLIFIALILSAVASQIFAAWAKITHKQYANDALTVAVTLEIGSIAIVAGWLLVTALKKKKVNF